MTKPITPPVKQTQEWEIKELKKLEGMMMKISRLTGQHYQEEFLWESLVKGTVLDLWIYFSALIDAKLASQKQEMVEKIRKWAKINALTLNVKDRYEEYVNVAHLFDILSAIEKEGE